DRHARVSFIEAGSVFMLCWRTLRHAPHGRKGAMAAGIIVRDRLRRETAEIHERLHRHAGLAAAASGSIAADDYALLLARLFGFHCIYESVLAETASN